MFKQSTVFSTRPQGFNDVTDILLSVTIRHTTLPPRQQEGVAASVVHHQNNTKATKTSYTLNTITLYEKLG